MATIKKCDRCGRARPGKYYTVVIQIAEQVDETSVEQQDQTVIPDCCEHCLNTITKCVTLKKKPRKAKPKGSAKPRTRKPRKPATPDADYGQSELQTPNGAPAKPAVPSPPEG